MKQKNQVKEELLRYLMKVQNNYSKLLGSCLKFNLTIQNESRYFLLTEYYLFVEIYILKEFAQKVLENQNENQLCFDSFQKSTLKQGKKLSQAYRIPISNVINYSQGILPVQKQPIQNWKSKKKFNKKQSKFKLKTQHNQEQKILIE